MWPTWNSLFLSHLLLIAAIEYIDLPKAGCDSVETTSAQFSLGNPGLSNLYNRKMKTYFRRLDFNEDGVISGEDFDGMAVKFADMENFDPVKKNIARKTFKELFSTFISAAGTKDDVPLTEDLLIESMKIQRDTPEFKQIVGDIVRRLLAHMKVEEEGYFDYDEYRRIFEDVGIIHSEFTKAAFVLVDGDHDKRISETEFLDAAIDYMCSDDANSTAMFGLLV